MTRTIGQCLKQDHNRFQHLWLICLDIQFIYFLFYFILFSNTNTHTHVMLSHGHTNFGQSLGKIPKDKQKQAFNYTESKTGMLSKLRVEHNKNDEKKKL